MKYLMILCGLIAASLQVNAECPNIITKKEWGGTANLEIEYIVIPMKYAVIEHTAGEECFDVNSCTSVVYEMQRYHVDTLDYHDIGYNFLIGSDGNVYEGVGWHKVGAHTIGWNKKSLAIAFLGNFSEKLPPAAALNAAKKLLECGVEKGELDTRYKLLGHKQILATASPGARLYREIVRWPNWSAQP